MEFFKTYFYWMLWAFGLLMLMFFYIHRIKKIRTFLLGAGTGLTALFLLHFYGGLIGCTPTLCLTNLLTCGLFGIPGAALLILEQALIK